LTAERVCFTVIHYSMTVWATRYWCRLWNTYYR